MEISKNRNRFFGTVFSYLNTFISMAITIFLVPLLLAVCGESEYSVYKVMLSFASPVAIMNFGIANYVSRGMAQCNQKGELSDNPRRQRILGMSLLISGLLCTVAVIVAVGLYSLMDVIYVNTFSADEMFLAKKLFVILAANTTINILGNGFQGCITGNEHFIVSKTIILGKTCLKALCIFVMIVIGCNTVIIAICDLVLSVLTIVIEFVFIKCSLREKFRFDSFEKTELKIFMLFATAMLLQTVINNINNSMDNVILGAMISDKAVITMYSSALTIYSAFVGISYTISGIYAPSIVRAVTAELSNEELTAKAIVPAKFQAIVAVSVCLGFVLFGDNFVIVWIGEKYSQTYYVVIMLMIPSCLVTVSGIYEAFLDAKLKRLVRSLILLGMAVYNFVVSVVLIKFVSFWGAAIGTATSLIFGNLIIMNLYSAKISGVSVLKLYKGAFAGIWKAILLTSVLCVPMKLFLPKTLSWFIVKIVLYVIIYAVSMLLIGVPSKYRKMVFKKIGKK